MLSDWLISLEGTEQGHQVALILAVSAAFLHAVFGALQKGRHDPWLSRGAIDASYGLMAAPFALFVVPWPEPHMWLIFVGVWVIHVLYKVLQAMAYTKGAYTVVYPVVRGTGPLKGIDVDPALVPVMIDEFPILAMIAACAEGTTTMTGLAELRVKESDRLLMVANGLKACGVSLEMGEDSLTINSNGQHPIGGATIETALDHRIAMSFALIGLLVDGISILDPGCVAKTYPEYWRDLESLGVDLIA
mgnify:CR=1 FL=1